MWEQELSSHAKRSTPSKNRLHWTDWFPVNLYKLWWGCSRLKCKYAWVLWLHACTHTHVLNTNIWLVCIRKENMNQYIWHHKFSIFSGLCFLICICVYSVLWNVTPWGVFKCKEVSSFLTLSTWNRSVPKGCLFELWLFRRVGVRGDLWDEIVKTRCSKFDNNYMGQKRQQKKKLHKLLQMCWI